MKFAMSFTYDNLTDSILVFSKKSTEHVQGSVKMGNLVLDLTPEGNVVGIEIRKATGFFKMLGLKTSFETVESATLSVKRMVDGVLIFIRFKFENKEEKKFPIFVSAESPQFAMT